MAPLNSFCMLLLAFLFLGVAPSKYFAFEQGETSIPFTYSGSHGPSHWGTLNPNYTACSAGHFQSPVNIMRNQTTLTKALKPLIKSYIPANATLLTNGVNVGIHFESECGSMNIDEKKYSLKQLHWHSPSEHKIDGIEYPLELHLVHQLQDGSFSVIGILFQYGEPDPFLTSIEKSLDKLAKKVTAGDQHAKVYLGTLNAKLIKKISHRFFRYVGSLTTPPCSENVVWNVIPTPRTVSKKQIELLKAPLGEVYKNNNRPCQALDGRKIEIAPRASSVHEL
ncbi:alpha carbonic anhydrase 1, chloroplastic-like [Mercurialis annua]|uniref:alpha carbonic anhydrase 1, chloroplastic-like n=1 Tax=Mercurialis annua TaxID=3986 RepID=UPI00215FE100|nr:alpha carbonic anhydrase 1, chloroplastic-like [Mercurialis annua]